MGLNEQEVLGPVLAIEVDEVGVVEKDVEEIQEALGGSAINKHCSRIERPIARGKNKGKMAEHFKCNYCSKAFVGPSNSSFTFHLKKDHKRACPELLESSSRAKPKNDFFKIVAK